MDLKRTQVQSSYWAEVVDVAKQASKKLTNLERVVLFLLEHECRMKELVLREDREMRAGDEKTLHRVTGAFLWPVLHLDMPYSDTILVVGLKLLYTKQGTVEVVEKGDTIALAFGDYLYTIKPPSFGASLVLIMNRGSPLSSTIEKATGTHISDAVDKSLQYATPFYRNLKKNYGHSPLSVYFADGYLSYATCIDRDTNTKVEVKSYTLYNDVYHYYGVNSIYVDNAKNLEALRPLEIDAERTLQLFKLLNAVVERIRTVLPSAFILTRMLRNIL